MANLPEAKALGSVSFEMVLESCAHALHVTALPRLAARQEWAGPPRSAATCPAWLRRGTRSWTLARTRRCRLHACIAPCASVALMAARADAWMFQGGASLERLSPTAGAHDIVRGTARCGRGLFADIRQFMARDSPIRGRQSRKALGEAVSCGTTRLQGPRPRPHQSTPRVGDSLERGASCCGRAIRSSQRRFGHRTASAATFSIPP